MLENISNGYHIFFLKAGQQMVVKSEGGKITGVNLDGIDPDEHVSIVEIDKSEVACVENISDDRFHYMREMAMRRAKIQDLQSITQLAQILAAAKESGLVQDTAPPAQTPPPPSPMPPKLVTDEPPVEGETAEVVDVPPVPAPSE